MKLVKKILKIVAKLFAYLFLGIISTVLFAWIGLNIAKFGIYNDYYSIKTNICTNPGLNEGAVPQGIAVSEDEDLILTTAYMKDNSASRIYLTNSKNEVKSIKLMKNGKPFTGHVGGISLSGNTAYISNGDKIYPISLDDLKNNDEVDIKDGIKVNNQASFTFADDKYLYVGEFNYSYYVCEHPLGDYNAICTVYSSDDLTTPVKIYSIRDKVQGFCVTDEGKIVLSTSWSVSSSVFYVYEEEDVVDAQTTIDGAPVYILQNASKEIKAPAMSEDLSYKDGKVYTMFESACDKYIFGKFFFATKVVALDI